MGFVKGRLGGMMFLQYAVWGFWLPILAQYFSASVEEGGLGFTQTQVNLILGFAAASGALTAPFLAGQLADRYFSTERFLAFLCIAGGIVQFVIASQTSFIAWLLLAIVYSICFQPTVALSNSMAFANLEDASNEFPFVRVWGTIGWIAASWFFPMVWLQTNLSLQWLPPFFAGDQVPDATARLVDAMRFSGAASFVYAGFCLFLPHTPPKKDSVESLAFVKAFRLMKKRSFAVLVLASLPISVIHQIYFAQTAPFLVQELGIQESHIGPAMSIGQFAEIIVIAFLGLMLTKFGFRWTMCLGGAAYVLRYAIFGTVDLPVPVIIASQALHGFCFSCFFAAAFIYVDRIAESDVRHSAQTVFGIIILGGGPMLAGPFVWLLTKVFGDADGVLDYSTLWYVLAVVGLITTIAFGFAFRDETQDQEAAAEGAGAPSG